MITFDGPAQRRAGRSSRIVGADRTPQAVAIAIGIAIIAECLVIGRSLLNPPQVYVAAPVGPRIRKEKYGIDVAAITRAHLFGVEDRPAPSDSDAPPSQQSLVLSATLATSDPEHGFAILGDNAAAAQVYAVGATVTGGAILQRVFTDHVILNRGGALERLSMLDRTAAQTGTIGAKRPIERLPEAQAISVSAAPAESDATLNVPVRMESFRILPVYGALGSGVRIGLPKDPREFEKTGLKPGDIVTSINGARVGSTQSAAEIIRSAAGGMVTLTVQRGAETQTIQVDSLN